MYVRVSLFNIFKIYLGYTAPVSLSVSCQFVCVQLELLLKTLLGYLRARRYPDIILSFGWDIRDSDRLDLPLANFIGVSWCP